MTDEGMMALLRERLGPTFDIQKVVLFGSRARGDAAPDSDWDLLVITDSDIPFIPRQQLALKSLGSRDFSVDLLVYTPQEAQEASGLLGSALYWASQEGKVLYAK